MCGRYVTPDEAALERFWNLDRRTWNPLRERFNVAPTTAVPIIRRADDGAHELCAARWGLIPHWWSKGKPPTLTFNARSEDAAAKPMWRHAYRHERCLMPARGWYEWRQRTHAGSGGPRTGKQPYFIYCEASPIIAFAGLMAHWQGPDGHVVVSCALLSRAAAPSIADIHERMPVVLPPDSFEPWLAPELSAEDVGSLIAGARGDFVGYPVSTRVNDTRNDAPDLLDEVSDAP